MTQINDALRNALLEVARPSDVDQALEKIGPTGRVRDLANELGFDSLDQIEFILALEEGLDIDISDAEAEKFLASNLTLDQLLDTLQAKRDRS